MNYCDNQKIDGIMFERFIIGGGNKLKENLEEINDLNVFPIPDGDTGTNMYRTLSGGIKQMQECKSLALSDKAKALAHGMLLNARGNSGVILSQIFAGISKGLEGLEVSSLYEMGEAFIEGVKTAYKAVITPVEGTILTVARESIEETIHLIDDKMTLGTFAALFMERMEKSLENTPELLDVLKEAGVIDSGGAGLYLIAEGVTEVINGKEYNDLGSDIKQAQNQELDLSKFTKDSVLEYGYCTEFLLRLMTKKCDVDNFDPQVIIDYLSTIGDSIVAFKNDSIVKVHVHTMTPSKALEFCQQFGEFLTIKIENMTIQHNEVEEKKSALPTAKKARANIGICVVTTGSGIIEVFKELGASYIIDGGQGKNPSINDFISAFDEMNCNNIFVFPNNSNIIMAANQAKELYKGESKIFVIPSKNIGEAYASLAMLNLSIEDPYELENKFISDMECVETGMVCKAIRSVSYKDIDVKNDDYIGFTNKKVLSSNEDKVKALYEMTVALGLNEKDIITIVYGADVTENEKEEVRKTYSENNPNVEFYEIDGKQEVYDFIAILE
ncbi:MAG: DAK2 domain-containing protein [Bacilli bacterium]|nr:DAK2 domain-containing protein [Bacilli bacterium]